MILSKRLSSKHSSSNSNKRKQNDQGEDDDICSSIKRVRITYTPGEIRLNKDIEQLNDISFVDYQLTSNPASILLNFNENNNYNSNGVTPNNFMITVPRYYPHSKPVVKCLDNGYTDRFISQSGEVTHHLLNEDWNAICGITDVVNILNSIREESVSNNINNRCQIDTTANVMDDS